MDVGVDDDFGVFQDFLRAVGEDDFRPLTRHFLVKSDVVHTREGVFDFAESFVHLFFREHVRVRVHAVGVERVDVHKMVAHLVGRIAEHNDELVHALGNAFEEHRKTVARQNGEDEPDRAAARLCADVLCNLVHGGIVALRTRHDGFRDGKHVPVLNGKTRDGVGGCRKQALRDYEGKVVPFLYDWCFDTSGNRTDCCHNSSVAGYEMKTRSAFDFLIILQHAFRVNNKSRALTNRRGRRILPVWNSKS